MKYLIIFTTACFIILSSQNGHAQSQVEIGDFGLIKLNTFLDTPSLDITNSSSFFLGSPFDPIGGINYNSVFHTFKIVDVPILEIKEDEIEIKDIEVQRTQSGSRDLLPYAYGVFRRDGGVNSTQNSTGNFTATNTTGGAIISLSTSLIASNMTILVTPITIDITAASQVSIEYLTGADDHKFKVAVYSKSGSSLSDNFGFNFLVFKP